MDVSDSLLRLRGSAVPNHLTGECRALERKLVEAEDDLIRARVESDFAKRMVEGTLHLAQGVLLKVQQQQPPTLN